MYGFERWGTDTGNGTRARDAPFGRHRWFRASFRTWRWSSARRPTRWMHPGVLSGQDVTWELFNSAPSIVSVIDGDGPAFKLRGETVGEARVTVRATNSSGSASVTMAVTVRIASEEETRALKNVLGGQTRMLLGSAVGVIGTRIAQWNGPALISPSFTGARPAAIAGGTVPAVGAPAPTGAAHGGSWNRPFAFSLDTLSPGFMQSSGRNGRLLPAPTRGAVEAPDGVPWWTVWGAGDMQTFNGGEGDSAYEGEWRTAWLGTDLRIAENAMFGLALSFGEGVADYGFEGLAAGAGQIETDLAAIYPYIKSTTSGGGTELWLLGGVGAGEALNRRELQEATDQADLAMGLLAAGARLRLLEGYAVRLSVLADLGAAMLRTEGENSLAELESMAQRVRVGLELAGSGGLSPFFQLSGATTATAKCTKPVTRPRAGCATPAPASILRCAGGGWPSMATPRTRNPAPRQACVSRPPTARA